MKVDKDGNLISSSAGGATNANQKGTRTPEPVAGNASSKNPNPTYDISPDSSGKVGPDITGGQGLSGSPDSRTNPGQIDATVKAKNLPEGLVSVQDGPDHIIIKSSKQMTMEEYQSKLNQIPWDH